MPQTIALPTAKEHANFVCMLETCFPTKEGNTYLQAWLDRYGEDAHEIHNDLQVDLLQILKNIGFKVDADANKPPLQSYCAWHFFIGSTIDAQKSPLLDLPEPYSIVPIMQMIKDGAKLEEVLAYIPQPTEAGHPLFGANCVIKGMAPSK